MLLNFGNFGVGVWEKKLFSISVYLFFVRRKQWATLSPSTTSPVFQIQMSMWQPACDFIIHTVVDNVDSCHGLLSLFPQEHVSSHTADDQTAFCSGEIAILPDGHPRGMTVSSFWGDAPTVCDNALLRWPPSPAGSIPFGLLHCRCLVSGHRQEQHGERHRAGQRIRPSCVHKSEPDNCAGGELRADWLQRDRRAVPQFPVVQLPWRPSGHGEWWGPDPYCHSKPCSAVDVTPLKFYQQRIHRRHELTWCGCLLHNSAFCKCKDAPPDFFCKRNYSGVHRRELEIVWKCSCLQLKQSSLSHKPEKKALKGPNRHSHTNSTERLENEKIQIFED